MSTRDFAEQLTAVPRVNPEDLALAEMLTLDFVDLQVCSNEQPLRSIYELHGRRMSGRDFMLLSPKSAVVVPDERRRGTRPSKEVTLRRGRQAGPATRVETPGDCTAEGVGLRRNLIRAQTE